MGHLLTSTKTSPRLTPRETEVLSLLARGMKAPAIADELKIARNTARVHVQSILWKLGLHSQLEVVVWAYRSGAGVPAPWETGGRHAAGGPRRAAHRRRPRAASDATASGAPPRSRR